ncbi:hypothetical protein PTKIN_Ptkin01aG0375300 [Pterospermum kingtungense]
MRRINGKFTVEIPTEEFFEPNCKWKRDIESDTLDIDLDVGFRRESLKATRRKATKKIAIILITAESPKSFRREIEINTDDYDIEKVRAVFSVGNLKLELPKKVPTNVLEISRRKWEITKWLKESAQDMQNKILTDVEDSCSKKKLAAYGFMLLVAIGFFACKYYTEC